MARVYSCEITERRTVAIDGPFQCPNPQCRYASPVRVFGQGEARRTHKSGPGMWTNGAPITELPATLVIAAKKEAEASAWRSAQQRVGQVVCPRCSGNIPPWASFAAPL